MQTGTLNDIPLEAVIYTAKDLKKKTAFIPDPVKFSRGGGKSVSDMLSNMSEEDAKKYLEQMKLDNPDLLNEVKKYFLLFDDVIAMPNNIAASFWGSPDIEDLDVMATALAELDTDTIEKYRDYLPGKKAAMFTPKTEEDNISDREIEEAKGQIKGILQKKIDSGEMNIEDILASPEIEEE